jgi:hypothetical protein
MKKGFGGILKIVILSRKKMIFIYYARSLKRHQNFLTTRTGKSRKSVSSTAPKSVSSATQHASSGHPSPVQPPHLGRQPACDAGAAGAGV